VPSAIFVCESRYRRQIARLSRELPQFEGDSITIRSAAGLRDRHGPVHAGSFLRKRAIAFNCSSAEFPRIFVHELFHFVWLRAGNRMRREFEELLRSEWRAGATGELGWSAEWRKLKLTAADVHDRTRRWRAYCCESFCDSAAWLYAGVDGHSEYTLARRYRDGRRAWFCSSVGEGPLRV
jgi:hypothetical protein